MEFHSQFKSQLCKGSSTAGEHFIPVPAVVADYRLSFKEKAPGGWRLYSEDEKPISNCG